MATTDTRPGFRLPWSVGHRQTGDETPVGEPSAADQAADSSAIDDRLAEIEAATERAAPASPDRAPIEQDGPGPEATMTPAANSQQPAAEADEVDPTGRVDETTDTDADARTSDELAGESSLARAALRPQAPHPGQARRPTKFLAELTKAMQLAAQAERDATLAQYRAEATSFIEQLHARSSEQAAGYRRRADDDLAAIREWSKAEIARIREETERRMSDRKSGLEEELAAHAARIEHAIERVQARVEAYAHEMGAFFERLRTLEDPTTFAALAASLPEPPPFEVDLTADELVIPATTAAESAAVEPGTAATAPEAVEAAAEPASGEPAPAEPQAVEPAVTTRPEPVATPFAGRRSSDPDTFDTRIAALGLTPDFAAAEAQAAADATGSQDVAGGGEGDDDAGVAVLGDEALAARLASLVPSGPDPLPPAPGPATTTTQVVVVGLVSVASIASFKRHLARVSGVQSVGVSSGPDGEFVFTVVHREDVAIDDAVPALPGFQARVSSAAEGIVRVTARDPESEA